MGEDVRWRSPDPSGHRRRRDAEIESDEHVARLGDEAAKAVVVGQLASGFAQLGIMPVDDCGASFARVGKNIASSTRAGCCGVG